MDILAITKVHFSVRTTLQFYECIDAWLPNRVWYGNDSMAYDYQMGYELKSDNGWEDLHLLIKTLNFDTENVEACCTCR